MIYSTIEITGDVKNGKKQKVNGNLLMKNGIDIKGDISLSNGGTSSWGKIKGDINNQTDLITLLNEKADASDIPTKTSELINDGDGTSNFATESYVSLNGGKIDKIKVNGIEQTTTNKTVNIANATTSLSGAMSSTDKAKLDGIETGAQVNTVTLDSRTVIDPHINTMKYTFDMVDANGNEYSDEFFPTNTVGNMFANLENEYVSLTTFNTTIGNAMTALNAKADKSELNGYVTDAELAQSLADYAVASMIPTNVSQLTNDSGYITGINSSMVISALGYTPYNSTNPNGYTSDSALTTADIDEVCV